MIQNFHGGFFKLEMLVVFTTAFLLGTLFEFQITAKNTVFSPNLLVWKLRGKAQFRHLRIAQNYAELCLSTKFPPQQIK